MSMFDRSVPQVENRTDERLDAWMAPAIRRGDLMHKAKDQRFRYRKDLGLPNQVCLFRRRILTVSDSVRQYDEHPALRAKCGIDLQFPCVHIDTEISRLLYLAGMPWNRH